MLGIVHGCAAADGGETLQHLGKRITGKSNELDEAARFDIAKRILLQVAEFESELEQVPAFCVSGVIDELINIGNAVLRIVILISQLRVAWHGKESQPHMMMLVCEAGQ